jgi:hypothetical protein
MRSPESRRRRRQEVATRAVTPDPMWSYCRIIGCPHPTRIGAGKGLNRKYCRRHEDHFQRHGSYTQRSFTAAQLAPCRKAARAFLRSHSTDTVVASAIVAVQGLYARSGAHVEAFRLRGLSPVQRTAAVWAALREVEVDPVEPLAAWLAVELAIALNPGSESKSDFKRVQAAKLVHRMAGGSHRRWQRERPDGRVLVEVLHKYPHSRGRILRHTGMQLERAAELVVERHLDSLVESRIATRSGAK